MKRIVSLAGAKNILSQGGVLVFKPYHQQVTCLSLNNKMQLTLFNDNVRYHIDDDTLSDIIIQNHVYEYEKNNAIEINQEFKKLIQ